MRARRWRWAAVLAMVIGAAGAAAAIVGLPAGGASLNIDPAQSAGVSDIVGGSLAGAARLPWATFEQRVGSAQQIFVRVFKNGAWVTQGPTLNIDQSVEAEAPSIDFAGAKRAVPWDAWYEPSAALGGQTQVFASRFCAATNAVCAAGNTWVPEGQDRGAGKPSLNINTDRAAENPSVAGGATVAANDPVPWVAWQEQDGKIAGNGGSTRDQIFVSKGTKQPGLRLPCTGVKPSANASVGVFCWQEVGLGRLAKDSGPLSTGDPTLNIDPSRDGVEPDIAFTGPGDTVAWVAWYEQGTSALGLRANEQVFAAKIVADAAANGGFRWQAEGSGTAATVNPLDVSGPNSFGSCAASTAAEDACSLNKVPTRDAEDARVAAGTLVPGKPTVPWVTWAEDIGGGRHGIFVSRLVGGTHFEPFNGGRPVSNTGHDATRPDITFLGNVPYVSWTERISSKAVGFVGHFEGSAFVVDTPGGIRSRTGRPVGLIDFRVPITSDCTADPFTADGSACPGGVPDGASFTFTRAGSPQRLLAAAVGPCTVITGCLGIVVVHDGVATVAANLGQPAPVGILVHRILSQRRVRGRLVRRLRLVGRVPFGPRREGALRVRWNLRVRGHALPPGRYLVTLRAFDARGRAIARAKPVVVVIRP